jgi:hypothetical protein
LSDWAVHEQRARARRTEAMSFRKKSLPEKTC